MKKKILVLLMVCILALSMSAAVFAAGSYKITVTALYQEPEIKVNVPSAGELYLNPKRLPLVVNGTVEDGQIINTPWCIENQSECAVIVDASVYAAINGKSDMTLSTKSLADSTLKSKRAFIYLDKRVTDPGTDLESLDWDQTVYDSQTQILVATTTRERKNFMTLAGADEEGTPLAGSVGALRLSGDAIAEPKTPWNPAVDNISVRITFTFRPTAAPAA